MTEEVSGSFPTPQSIYKIIRKQETLTVTVSRSRRGSRKRLSLSTFAALNLYLLTDSKMHNPRNQEIVTVKSETLQGSAPCRKTETKPEVYAVS